MQRHPGQLQLNAPAQPRPRAPHRAHTPAARVRPARGLGLLDALIGLVLLAVGMLALAGFQTRLVGQTTDAQTRAVAMQFANELLSTALVDPANLACYSVPASAGCASVVARNSTAQWAERVAGGLPGPVSVQALLAGTQLTVLIDWTAKNGQDTSRLQVVTDVQ